MNIISQIPPATQDVWEQAAEEHNWLIFAVGEPDPKTGKRSKFPTGKLSSEYGHEKIDFDRALGAETVAIYTLAEARAFYDRLNAEHRALT